jgi:hypothetical protein
MRAEVRKVEIKGYFIEAGYNATTFVWSTVGNPDTWSSDDYGSFSSNWEMGLPRWYILLWNRLFGDEITRLMAERHKYRQNKPLRHTRRAPKQQRHSKV